MNNWVILLILGGIGILVYILSQQQKKQNITDKALPYKQPSADDSRDDKTSLKTKIREKLEEVQKRYHDEMVGYYLYIEKNRDTSLEERENELFESYPKVIAKPFINWKNEFEFVGMQLSLVEEEIRNFLSLKDDFISRDGYIFNEYEDYISKKAKIKADEIIKKIKG